MVSTGELTGGVAWWDVSSVYNTEEVSNASSMKTLSLETPSNFVVGVMLIWKLF